MDIWTYLAFALLMMGIDAVAAYISRVPYRLGLSMIIGLLWPVTIPMLITEIIKEQKEP